MYVRAIVNPISGRRNAMPALQHLREILGAQGYELDITSTAGAGDAARLAAETPDRSRAVIAVGGDGTVRETAEGLIDRNVPLAVYPNGTENIIARELGVRPDAERLAQTIINGEKQPCDVGICNGRQFLIMLGVGFDAEVVHRLAAARAGHISYLNYLIPFWKTMLEHRYPDVTVHVDGEKVFTGKAMVFAGIMPRYALGLRLLSRARMDDGLLDVCIMPCVSKLGLVCHSIRALFRRHLRHPAVKYRQCKTLRIEAGPPDATPVQMDGDPAGTLPIECSLKPGALSFLLPPGPDEGRNRR